MSILTCPHCDGKVELTVRGAKKKADPASPITPAVMRAVLEFMRQFPNLKEGATELFARYGLLRETRGWPEITPNAFGRALAQNGAKRWRTSTGRGYVIPEITSDQKPAGISATARARSDREAYQQALIDHSVDRVVQVPDRLLSESPFELS